jgi:hypothetical protein
MREPGRFFRSHFPMNPFCPSDQHIKAVKDAELLERAVNGQSWSARADRQGYFAVLLRHMMLHLGHGLQFGQQLEIKRLLANAALPRPASSCGRARSATSLSIPGLLPSGLRRAFLW